MSSPWRDEIRRGLCGEGPARVVLLGVGNRLRGDDGAGSLLAARLAARGIDRAFDGGTTPENYCELVAALSHRTVFIADAACFGGREGEVRLLDPRSLGAGAFSTHGISLRPLAAYLEERCGCRVVVVGIQPAAARDGEGVSPAVTGAVAELEDCFAGLLGGGAPGGAPA